MYDDNLLWAAIQANQKEIAEARLSTAQALGTMGTQLASIQATMASMQKLLESKQDRDEDKVYRAWQNERYQQARGYPAEQREQRNSFNVSMQTLFYFITTLIALAALFGVKL